MLEALLHGLAFAFGGSPLFRIAFVYELPALGYRLPALSSMDVTVLLSLTTLKRVVNRAANKGYSLDIISVTPVYSQSIVSSILLRAPDFAEVDFCTPTSQKYRAASYPVFSF